MITSATVQLRPEVAAPAHWVHPLDGVRTDAYRIAKVAESSFHHLDEQCMRARRNAAAHPEFAAINRELQLALGHLAKARDMAAAKRRALA